MKSLTVGIGLALLFSSVVVGNAQTQKPNKDEATKVIRIWDACDPATFNAQFGAGTCIAGQHGTTLLPNFIGELQLDKIAGAWRFNPLLDATQGVFKLVRLQLEPGDKVVLQNKGGELHTFTRVNEFGGGFIDVLNGLTGNPIPVPECAQRLPNGTLIPQPESTTNQFVEAGTTEAGPTAGTADLPAGVSHWECCIHPWMRLNIVVKEDQNENEHEH